MTIRKRITVGSDGNIVLAVGLERAGTEMEVVVSDAPRSPASDEEWHAFLRRTAGSIDDPTFFRHPQGEFEQRDPIE
ncbi:MAG: hypothetical protein ACAI43_13690 [Phycisphaerae bacterium]|nr:hypothetical protein [Tepidisphaeraceae bacterium]